MGLPRLCPLPPYRPLQLYDTRYTRSNIYIEGSRLRAGVFYMGNRVAGRSTRLTVDNDAFRLIPLPDYTLFDASVGYQSQGISIRVKVSNLLNVLSYQVHDDNSVNPIAPRQLSASVSYRF